MITRRTCTDMPWEDEAETDLHRLEQRKSKINRLRRSPKASQPPPRKVETSDITKPAFKTPTRPVGSRSGRLISKESPLNNSINQHDIIWDQNSPSPVRKGGFIRGRGRRKDVYEGKTDVNDLVSRIAPKSGKPVPAWESSVVEWIGDGGIPCTPELSQPRTKTKVTSHNTHDYLKELARQFDVQLNKQEEPLQNESAVQMGKEDLQPSPNENLPPFPHRPLSVMMTTTNPSPPDAVGALSLDLDMDDDELLNELFDGPTVNIENGLSQPLSGASQIGKATQSTSQPRNGPLPSGNSHVRVLGGSQNAKLSQSTGQPRSTPSFGNPNVRLVSGSQNAKPTQPTCPPGNVPSFGNPNVRLLGGSQNAKPTGCFGQPRSTPSFGNPNVRLTSGSQNAKPTQPTCPPRNAPLSLGNSEVTTLGCKKDTKHATGGAVNPGGFDNDWGDDDDGLLSDSLVMEMTQNPDLFAPPKHCSTQKPVPVTGPPGMLPGPVAPGNTSRQNQQQGGGNSSSSRGFGVPQPVPVATVEEKPKDDILVTECEAAIMADDDDLDMFFASDSGWDDGVDDDDLLCEACDDLDQGLPKPAAFTASKMLPVSKQPLSDNQTLNRIPNGTAASSLTSAGNAEAKGQYQGGQWPAATSAQQFPPCKMAYSAPSGSGGLAKNGPSVTQRAAATVAGSSYTEHQRNFIRPSSAVSVGATSLVGPSHQTSANQQPGVVSSHAAQTVHSSSGTFRGTSSHSTTTNHPGGGSGQAPAAHSLPGGMGQRNSLMNSITNRPLSGNMDQRNPMPYPGTAATANGVGPQKFTKVNSFGGSSAKQMEGVGCHVQTGHSSSVGMDKRDPMTHHSTAATGFGPQKLMKASSFGGSSHHTTANQLRANTGSMAGASQSSVRMGGDVGSQYTFKRPANGNKGVSSSTVNTQASVPARCSAAEIERKKQEALERRRRRMLATQNQNQTQNLRAPW